MALHHYTIVIRPSQAIAMSKLYLLFILIILLNSCTNPTASPSEAPLAVLPDTVVNNKVDSITIPNTLTTITASPKDSIPICVCKKRSYKRNPSTQLTFQAATPQKNATLIEEWANNPEITTIKSLRLMGYDTIPRSLAIFKQVNKVVLANVRGALTGLDIFPKLKELHFFGCQISLNSQEQWAKRVQILAAQKTIFSTTSSFRAFPNLRIIDFAFSGFKTFPSDLEALTCLQALHLNAYINGSKNNPLDLAQIDLSLFPCLRKVSFQAWQNAMIGLPKGTLAPSLERVQINHGNLTEEEKIILKDVKNILANRQAAI